MTCETCRGRTDGRAAFGEHICFCNTAIDPTVGISLRIIREYDLNALFGKGNTAQPSVPWQLTVEDKNLLRSMRIGVD